MTFEQIAIFVLLAGMMLAFGLSRLRFEVVALLGLAIGTVLGLVPGDAVFSGFASPTVITVIEILLIVQVLRRSALVALASDRLGAIADNERRLVMGLCVMGAALSVVMNNIGALALVLPLAVSVCERHGVAIQRVLMPLSFATLMGGLCSVVGTPANLLGASAIEGLRASPFGFFELALVGLPITLAGLIYLYFTTSSARPAGVADDGEGRHGRLYACEMTVPEGSALIGQTTQALASRPGLIVHNIVRDGRYVFGRGPHALAAGDLLVLESERAALVSAQRERALVASTNASPDAAQREAVILPESVYVGSTIADLAGFEAHGIAVTGAAVAGGRLEGRFADARLGVGDILVLAGDAQAIATECAEGGLLELAPTEPETAERPHILPAIVFACGIASAAFLGTPPELAFGLVILVLVLLNQLSLRQGLEDINWPILLLLGAMIPLGNAVAATGAANAVAEIVAQALPQANAITLAAALLAMAVVLTPFVNNPTTVLVLAPVGIAFADTYGVPATPALIAITIGASLDFLTPFGHHNNTLVMGIAGYRFIDFFRRGWPLLLLSCGVTIGAIALFYT